VVGIWHAAELDYRSFDNAHFMKNFLDTLEPTLRQAIRDSAVSVQYAPGESVFKRGDPGNAMYIIVSGSVRVHDGDLLLNTLEEGDVFGEIAGLAGAERTASVTAETKLDLFRVERDPLLNEIQNHPEALRELVRMLCERESSMADRMTARSWKLRAAEQELEIGRKIQAGFLPKELPEVDGYQLAAHFQAARVVAGDFYDAFLIPSLGQVALVIGDVCDKGVGAALFMTLFRSLIRATAQSRRFVNWAVDWDPMNTSISEGQDLETLIDETLRNTVALTNNYIAVTHGQTSMFASVFVGLLDPATGRIRYINAGHEEAFVIGGGRIKSALPPTGPVIGIFAGAIHEIATTVLAPGDSLLSYSDGVPEATSQTNEQFTEERLRGMLETFDGTAGDLIEMIINSITDFTQGARQHDDITMLACQRETG
jgi:sigma-B regulation protein RsbU (phosphoserine phosphatase)